MIPAELKLLNNWVGYKIFERDGREIKMPMSPITGSAAESNNRATWGSFQQATNVAKQRGWSGVGFMFEPPYVGIDLDDCVENGVINQFAKDILNKCKSYAEYSPSRTGIHIIGKGELERAIKTKEIEIYNRERYFTMTGNTLYPFRPISNLQIANIYTQVANKMPTEKGWLSEVLKNVSDGSRNNDFTRIAGSLRARGYSGGDIFDLLVSRAREVEFPESELQTICNSVGRYEPNQRIDESVASSIEEFLKDQETVEWICEGLIAKKSIGFIVGLPECGKTWLMIDLAIQCAKGDGLWLNKFPVKKQKVLFIDQERFKGETQRRFAAVMGVTRSRDVTPSNSLFVKSGTTIRLNLQNSFDAFRKELSELKPDLVIVDSFATFHLAEENSRKDIQVVLERVKELRNEFGCTFLFISHENKFAFDKEGGEPSIAQMAGSIAIPAAAETVLTVRKHDSESSMVYHTKSTLASTHEPFLIKVTDQNPEKTSIKVEAF